MFERSEKLSQKNIINFYPFSLVGALLNAFNLSNFQVVVDIVFKHFTKFWKFEQLSFYSGDRGSRRGGEVRK
jgi:hypothetical protein